MQSHQRPYQNRQTFQQDEYGDQRAATLRDRWETERGQRRANGRDDDPDRYPNRSDYRMNDRAGQWDDSSDRYETSSRARGYGAPNWDEEDVEWRTQGPPNQRDVERFQNEGGQGFSPSRDWQANRPGSRESYGNRDRSYATTSYANYGTGGYQSGMRRTNYASQDREPWGVQRNSLGQFESTRSGQYVGHGPKGYKRSDDRILEDVNEALSQHGDLDASNIEVKVREGEVVLTGTVEARQDKRLAEDIVERCSGVGDVRNEIRVQRSSEANGSATTQGQNANAGNRERSGKQESKAS